MTLSLAIEDAVVEGEPAVIRVRPSEGNPRLMATLTDIGTGAEMHEPLGRGVDGWQEVAFDLARGAYRVQVSGDGQVQPVSDLFVVTDAG